MPSKIGDLFYHKSPRIKTFDSDLIIGHLAKQAAASIGMIFSADGLSKDGYKFWAEMVLEDYPSLKLVEIKSIFKLAAKKTNYNRIDVNVIFGWVKDYWEHREELVSITREQHHRRLKNDYDLSWGINTIPAPEFFKERTKEMEGKIRRVCKRDYRTIKEKKQDLRDSQNILKSIYEEE